jgi:hypothetical protein
MPSPVGEERSGMQTSAHIRENPYFRMTYPRGACTMMEKWPSFVLADFRTFKAVITITSLPEGWLRYHGHLIAGFWIRGGLRSGTVGISGLGQ